MPFKKGDTVRVTTGKFRGWVGRVFMKDREAGITYYDLFADHRDTKEYGRIEASSIGLGLIINVPEKHLKEVV